MWKEELFSNLNHLKSPKFIKKTTFANLSRSIETDSVQNLFTLQGFHRVCG